MSAELLTGEAPAESTSVMTPDRAAQRALGRAAQWVGQLEASSESADPALAAAAERALARVERARGEGDPNVLDLRQRLVEATKPTTSANDAIRTSVWPGWAIVAAASAPKPSTPPRQEAALTAETAANSPKVPSKQNHHGMRTSVWRELSWRERRRIMRLNRTLTSQNDTMI